jgi:Pro-kumamolisin, activation domain/Bacterial Ig-like domain (group 1)/Invasin, domain 3/Subtilase family
MTNPPRRTRIPGVVPVVLLTLWSGTASALGRIQEGAADGRIALSGHVLAALSAAERLTPLAGRTSAGPEPALSLTIVLRRSDPGGFAAYLEEVYDQRSPRYLEFMTASELADRFGPSQQDYEAVRSWFEGQGFTVGEAAANRMTLSLSGTRRTAERALDVAMAEYRYGDRAFVANDAEPRLPGEIAPKVQAVIGLSNLARPQPVYARTVMVLCFQAAVERGVFVIETAGGGYEAAEVCKAYVEECTAAAGLLARQMAVAKTWCDVFQSNPQPLELAVVSGDEVASASGPALAGVPRGAPTFWKDVDGTGQTIAITAFDSFLSSDVADYLDLLGMPASVLDNLSRVHLNGGAPLGPNQSEVLLDVDAALVGASGANVVVYDSPFTGAGSFQALFSRMIDDGVTIISNSWAYCEDQTTAADVESIDAILATAAASGISVFNATGDTGSTCLDGSPDTVAVPAGSPHATAVGGSTLTRGPAATHQSETWWDGATDVPATGQGGFGLSAFFARPAYQNGFHGSPMRSVPDVVFDADPAQGIVICQASAGGCPAPLSWGGTSVAAPIWAAGTALLNQALGQNLGNLNPTLYPLAASGAFHTPADLGSDFAHVGLGSPKLNTLLLAIQAELPGPVSASVSEVKLIRDIVSADGASQALVVVRLRDAEGNVVTGKAVELVAPPGSSAVITPASGVADEANGAVIFEVTNATIEDLTLTATDTTDGIELSQTATVDFVAPPAASGGIQALPALVAADGVSTTTITVTLLDQNGMGAVDKVVTLDQGPGRSKVSSPTPATTNASGQVTFSATNLFSETVTYTAIDVSDGDLSIPGPAAVTFTNASPQPCPLAQPMAAAGYAVSSFATSLPFGFFGGCGGAAGMAFDRNGNLFVVDVADGHLYRFGAAGGVANASTRLTTTPYPIASCVQGLAFSQDGEHLFMARQGCGIGGDVVEISPTDGHVIRTVAPNILCATGLATDPLSGDLFVSSPCPPGGPGTGGTNQIHRIVNPTAALPTVVPYATPGHAQGLTFTPDGTLWATPLRFDLNPDRRDLVKISGTGSASPGQVTILLSQLAADPLFVATNAVPALDPADPGNPATLYVANGTGGVNALDLTQAPPVVTPMATGGDVVIFMIGGPDGCLYLDDMDRVVRVTAADGSCGVAPTTAAPTLLLSPSVATPNPNQGTGHSLNAQFANADVPAGTPVFFSIVGANDQLRMVRTDGDGRATLTYHGVRSGRDDVIASAAVDELELTSNRARVTWEAGDHTTSLGLDASPTGARAGLPVTLAAALADVSVDPPVTIAGATVELSVGAQSCSDTTDAGGLASCDVTLPTAGVFTLTADFAGSPGHLPASDSRLFTVTADTPVCGAGGGYDIDLDAQLAALSDGLLVVRHLFGFSGATLVAGAVGNGATRADPAVIAAYLDCIAAVLVDIDGDGQVQALTDGLLLLRYLFGFRGPTLIAAALGQGCTRCDAASIEGFIQSVLGE